MCGVRRAMCLLLLGASTSSMAATWQDSLPFVHRDALNRTMPYRVFLPPGRDPAREYPLVLFLHGLGECGTDNQLQVRYNISSLISATQGERFTSYLVAPQVPVGDNWLSERSLTLVTGILAEVQSRYPADENRLYVTGLSMGGFGTIGQLYNFPERYAAGVPIASGVDAATAAVYAPVMKDMPIWIFHGSADTTVPVEWSRALYQALLKVGGTPRYTEYPGVGHDSWTLTYADAGDALYPWLFSQSRYKPVVARCSLSVASGEAPLEVCFSAEESTGEEGAELVGFSWDFGDGAAAEGRTACHTYTDAGIHKVTLRVTDALERFDETTAAVTVHCMRTDVAPWSSADVGNPLIHGAARLGGDGGSMVICCGGRRLNGTADELHFVHRETHGNVTCTGRVSALGGPGVKGQAGVMVRDGLGPDARFASVTFRALSPNAGSLLFMVRTARGGTVAWGGRTVSNVKAPNAWVKIEKQGDAFIGSASVDGVAWQELERLSIPGFGETMFAGFAAMAAEAPAEGTAFQAPAVELTDVSFLECPVEGDTRCVGLVVQGPDGGGPGAYTVTASGEDDSGDAVIHAFTAQDFHGTTLSAGPQTERSAVFELTEGSWIITVLVDDSPYCDDVSAGNQCSTQVRVSAAGGGQLPGDVNQDGGVDVADAVYLLGVLFRRDSSRLPCGDGSAFDQANIALANWNGDATIDIADPICVLTWLFNRGPAHALGSVCRPIPGCPSICVGGR